MKLGSLFDGSGGFPLAGSLCGIEPVWAAEVEPYPIAVTKSRFPKMKHLGNICNINGAEIEPVDIICAGSPCQDLSVAGLRKGLKHEANGNEETTRSGLFMEFIRIIIEMRLATNGRYPTFALWENVPGAFSSNQGEDFHIVLEELIKVVEPTAKVPAPPKGGWAYADIYLGDGWSLAYRVFDAQYWGKTVIDRDTGTILQMGTPQRRRRIHLIADLRGGRAGEILFKREGLRGYPTASGETWQGVAGDAEDCAGATDREGENGCLTPWDNQSKRVYSADGVFGSLYAGENSGQCQQSVVFSLEPGIAARERGHIYEGVSRTLRANAGDNQMAVAYSFDSLASSGSQIKEQYLFENHSQDTRYKGPLDICPMLPAQLGTGGNNTPFVVEKTPVYCLQGNGIDRADTDGGNVPMGLEAVGSSGDIAGTLDASYYKGCGMRQGVEREVVAILVYSHVYCLQGNGIDRADTAGCNGKGVREDVCYTLNTIDRPAVAYAMKAFGKYAESDKASAMKARDYKDATDLVVECAGINCRNMTEYPELYPTLQAKPNGGQSLNFSGAVRVRYIVRRLTPTECARLQGFPDKWGHPDPKTELTDEEYAFWTEVRATHAVINGKEPKTYGREQILKWYNGLHTDSAEYKMWGNGIALPPALYCMQGMAQALEVGT